MDEYMFDVAKMLMSCKLLSSQEDIAETIEACIELACKYEHIRKGYVDEHGTWIENPDYTLLLHWITLKSGYYNNGKTWVLTKQEKARQRFG